MLFKKMSIVFLAAVICFCSSVNVAEAYVKEGWKIASKVVTYKWGDRLTSSGSTIRNGLEAADTAWYNAVSFNFQCNSSSVNVLNSWDETSSTYYGRMSTTYNSRKIVTKFAGDLNAGNSNISKSNVAKSTGVHEFGHAIGIGHNGETSIMNSNRDRTIMHVPQKDDINGVNAIY